MATENRHYNLSPRQGWDCWSHNPDLSDLIFDIGFENANSGVWYYINPMAGMGIFEDRKGQDICLETKDIGERNHILSMHCGLKENEPSDFLDFIEKLEDDYDLVSMLMETP